MINTVSVDSQLDTNSFSATQQERISCISHLYKEMAKEIVPLLSSRGTNSWSSFLEKMRIVNKSDRKVKEYYASLDAEFNLGTVYSLDEIIEIVTRVRFEMDLEPYEKRIKAQCEQDFLNLFIIKSVNSSLEDDAPKTFLGYMPIYRVKADRR